MDAVATPEDRTVKVPSGRIVRTDYVPMHKIELRNRSRMSVGDVESAFRRLLALGDAQPWPPPVGFWDGVRFVVQDGRHQYIAALMLGHSHLFVAWIE